MIDYNVDYYEHIKKYISENVDGVFKPAGNRFKYPFTDPGSVYDGNLWDWDTFWTIYSLASYEKTLNDKGVFKEKLIQAGIGNVLNFLDSQLDDGYIPMMIDNKDPGEDSYLIMKHKQGHILNMHKPFLCQQACVVSGLKGSYDWLEDRLGQLELYFKCYDRFYFNEKCLLYVWADDVMIGMDNDPASFGRPRFSTANVFLNSFMVIELGAMAKILKSFGREDEAKPYLKKAETLKDAIQKECYDPKDEFFYSVDVDIKHRGYDWFHKGLGVFWNTLPIKIQSWTGFLPLYAKIATKEQAELVISKHIKNPTSFCSDFGIRSLAKDEKMYNIEATNNPSNWLGPVWVVVNYVVFRGLLNYGYKKEAEELCHKTLLLLGEDCAKTGMFHEYYNPETGEPVFNPGYLDWNILPLNMVEELKGEAPLYDFFG